jgi:hypothetical protein
MFENLLMMIRMDKISREIAIRILLIPGVKRWFERIGRFYKIVQVEEELDMFNRKQKVCMINSTLFLPDTEERIERLRRIETFALLKSFQRKAD